MYRFASCWRKPSCLLWWRLAAAAAAAVIDDVVVLFFSFVVVAVVVVVVAPAEDTGGAGSELAHGQARASEGVEVQRADLQAGGDGEQRPGPG